jgi:lambda family phage portal protein
MKADGVVPAIARAVGNLFKHNPMKRSWLNSFGYMGSYATTDPSRQMIEGWVPRNATSDQTLNWNLTNLIAQLRQLERNNCTIKGLIAGWQADIIGTGIDVEPDTGDETLNAKIRTEWAHWCNSVTPDGKTLWELQNQAMIDWCCSGASFWHEITVADRIDLGHLPICFTPIETEWLTYLPIKTIGPDDYYTRGIQIDKIGRPIAYHVMDYELLNQQGLSTAWGGPGDVWPAAKIIHGFEQRRARQAHGEPLLAVVIERCYQDGNLVDTELKASRSTAAVAGAITSMDQQDWTANTPVVDQYGNVTNNSQIAPVNDMPLATWARLQPGEKLETIVNNRPAQGIDPFRRGIRGDVASGSRSSQQWIDRDSSRANYSSMRMDEILTTRVRCPVQATFGKYVASEPYIRVLPYILLKLGIPIPKNADAARNLFRHKLMFDKPQYVDPEKDSKAAIFMVNNSLSTLEEECSARGRDYRKIREQRAKEQADADADAVTRIKNVQKELKKQGVDADWTTIVALGGASTDVGAFLKGTAQQSADQEMPQDEPQKDPVLPKKGSKNAA